ncbi:clasp N terminal-domain-containing protein [Chaetomium strumarium]|uniref:Clasp N terminal-domain-containing protein n=1 Tax=Chaetomium strumarium TaxID=1170767 RepID=A0AAJ0M2T0_9PEZI|nr:clasp N terminal-domain-containing protein [Chaetomium strumarium]
MAERITDQQVADLIAILRTDASFDAKAQQVNAVKSSIKQHTVPETCIVPLFEALRAASSSQHGLLTNSGFTALNHLFTRLARQEPKYLAKEGARALPLIVEKLGDQKDKLRALAHQMLATLYKVAPLEVELSVRNTAMVGKNARAKEASLHWLLRMHQEHGLQFRAYVPTLMELLEDADGGVRDTAKSTVIELFRTAPGAAKSDLKKQLKTFKVRPAIEQAIVKALNPASAAPALQPDSLAERPPSRMAHAASVSSVPDRPVTPGLVDHRAEAVEPSYVNTSRELDEILRDMQPYFEDKETEQNWLKREESIVKLRRLVAGNAATDFSDQFLSGLRTLLDGILKAVNSLRTSLSKEGCSLVQDIARVYGPAMDPMVELLMQTFIKLAAATKKISSSLANTTVNAIISRATYNTRIMQHVWMACQDKNVQPRLYATGWLETLLNKEAHHKNHVEHTGGLDLIEKCIKKGLVDPNPGVREKMRATYWTFARIWPARAEAIMGGLDPTAARRLQKDPNNPNSPKKSEGEARPGMGLSKSTMGTSKPSLRDAMLAQKRAMTTKTLLARPGSAMSHFSAAAGSSQAPAATAPSTTARTIPESTILTSTGGLSGAPVRPGRRRPEMAARPATAGPYSVRSHDQPSAEQGSPPSNAKAKAVTPKSITSSPKRTVPKTVRPNQPASPADSHLSAPVRAGTPKGLASPLSTPSRTVRQASVPPSSSPSKAHEDFTLVLPTVAVPAASPPREDLPPANLIDNEPTTGSPSGTPSPSPIPRASSAVPVSPPRRVASAPEPGSPVATPPRIVDAALPTSASSSRSLKVYEDPVTREEATPKPIFGSVLEDRPVNEDASILQQVSQRQQNVEANGLSLSPEKTKQNLRLFDSGISKVQQKSLDIHGFRKLQAIIRDSDFGSGTAPLISDDKFDALTCGLFDFLESPLAHLPPEKAHDVKTQVLATIKLLLKRMRHSFQPHVSRGLESLLRARATYEGRTHIVIGLDLLASELAALGDASEIVMVLSRMLADMDVNAPGTSRSLSMGLHILTEMMDSRGAAFSPSAAELDALAALAARCLESLDSGVRMDAVLLCVALHARVGDARFWEAVRTVKDDPKSLITYYIARRKQEMGTRPVVGQAA